MAQLHKKFTDSQVKELIERYLKNEIEKKYIQEILGIGKTRFFALVYQKNGDGSDFCYLLKKGNRLYFLTSHSLLFALESY